MREKWNKKGKCMANDKFTMSGWKVGVGSAQSGDSMRARPPSHRHNFFSFNFFFIFVYIFSSVALRKQSRLSTERQRSAMRPKCMHTSPVSVDCVKRTKRSAEQINFFCHVDCGRFVCILARRRGDAHTANGPRYMFEQNCWTWKVSVLCGARSENALSNLSLMPTRRRIDRQTTGTQEKSLSFTVA